VFTVPGGAVIGVNYDGNSVVVAKPVDAAATSLTVYDIFPWRADAAGGASFEIGGANFGDLGNTAVTIGGAAASLTSVSPTRIRGTIPAAEVPPGQLVDVIVDVGGTGKALVAGFMYLP